jgi:hypothetical protein
MRCDRKYIKLLTIKRQQTLMQEEISSEGKYRGKGKRQKMKDMK